MPERGAHGTRKGLSPFLLAIFYALVMAGTVYGFYVAREWREPVAATVGQKVDAVVDYILITTGVLFVLGHVVLGVFVLKFRGTNEAVYRSVSRKAEWAWALVPVLVMAVISEVGVLVMGMPVWKELYGETPADAIGVEVVAKQFAWIVRYPGKDGKLGATKPELIDDIKNPVGLDKNDPAAKDDLIERGVLTLPDNKTASVRLRSHDVIHSFAVPAFRLKQDIIPGFVGHTQFRPLRTGQFEIACAELCGIQHYSMRGIIQVKTPEEFAKWQSEQKGWLELYSR